ncbi:MAG: leucine-rich repeat domain-containing protein [Clostridia bacterium]|nr:leucine-rich repeat domain-containing protein [Clostridia bacterium]
MNKNVLKKISDTVAVVFALVIFFVFSFSLAAAPATEGSCGENVTWRFETFGGTLTISGSGPMRDFGFQGAPWYALREEIYTVIIEDGVTSVGSYAFLMCRELTDITLPDSVTTIGDYAFCNCDSLKTAILSSNITSIGDYAFCSCKSLSGLELPKGVTEIGCNAFSSCRKLTEVRLPKGVTAIEEWTFSGCTGLTEIRIPKGVAVVGNRAFLDCDALTDVHFGGSQRKWNAIAVDEGNDVLMTAKRHYGVNTFLWIGVGLIVVGAVILAPKKNKNQQ